jgi:NADH-quinone oxidoreductase subunit H
MFDFISVHVPPWFFIAVIAHFTVLGTVAYMILLERKVASWVQDRIGPNRVGLGGLLPMFPQLKDMKMAGFGQPLADGIKFIVKEDYRAKGVDAFLFTLAPAIMITVVIISIAVIPWGGIVQTTVGLDVPKGQNPMEYAKATLPSSYTVIQDLGPGPMKPGFVQHTFVYRYAFQIAQLNIGVVYVLAVLSLAIYGVVIGGWASNNKYSFLGGLRATCNMISYEIPLGLCVLCVVLMFGTLDMAQIIEKQNHTWFWFLPAWNVFTQPLAFILFVVCMHAEANRAPFDLAEAEQELVGGYHTEYSAMRFALFFLSEYAGMITTSCIMVALFFGGWNLPFHLTDGHVDPNNMSVTSSWIFCIIRALILYGKALLMMFFFMWTRWSLPRFRFDQMMQLAWRALIPISLLLVLGTTIMVYVTGGRTFDYVQFGDGMMFLGMNVVALVVVLGGSLLIPAAPDTNRKITIPGSRFMRTPLPAGVGAKVAVAG